MVCGVDLVREQIHIAAGEPMSLAQDDVHPRGHAFECRINAEDASRRFLPAPAPITAYREPTGPGIRVDSGVQAGSSVPDIYDPMIAKLIVWDTDREAARRRMIRALDEYVIEGPVTLIPFHRWLFEQQEFIDGGACHATLAAMADAPTPIPVPEGRPEPPPAPEAPDAEPLAERSFTAEVEGKRFQVRLFVPEGSLAAAGDGHRAARPKRKREKRAGAPVGASGASGAVPSPMQGTVLKVLVELGQQVAAGDVICIVEAMKMENEVAAHAPGTVKELNVAEGQAVQADEVIAVLA
jgi:acetyl-CoA/propionyl-CoA carboxylase biotin carboxyl carrier protein